MRPQPDTTAHSWNLAAAQRLIGEGKFAAAEQTCNSILERDPREPNARFLRAVCMAQLGRWPEAGREADALVQDVPGMAIAHSLRADVLRNTGRAGESAAAYGDALAIVLGLQGPADIGSRVAALLELVATAPVSQWATHAPMMQAMGAMLASDGALARDTVFLSRAAGSQVPLARTEITDRAIIAYGLLGFELRSSEPWLQAMFQGVVLPWLQRALAADAFENALQLESEIYNRYVRKVENEEHFRKSFESWKEPMVEAGRRFASTLPSVPPRSGASGVPRLAFFVHNVVPLAHVQSLLETLHGHAELSAPIVEPWIFYLSGKPETIAQFKALGVRVEPLVEGSGLHGYLACCKRLRQRLAEEGIGTIVWLSAAGLMSFVYGMRIAPRQVWWALKYHALDLPVIDGYVTGGSQTGGSKLIHGREWRVGPVAGADWVRPELAAAASQVRSKLGAKGPVYGSFGREEKLTGAAFLDSVCEILRRQPGAAFLWTGRHRHAAIQARFDSAGVADRCHFIGWVDTKLYAQVIDIFLDSFPFPCGFTLYEAMAAGKPVVLFDSPESTHGGINALVAPLLREPEASEEARIAQSIFRPRPGVDLYIRPSEPAAYVEAAVALGSDPDFRSLAGEASRAFVERLMADRQRAAKIYLGHMLGQPMEG